MSRPKVLLLAATVLISLGILFLGGLQFFRKSHRRDIDSVGGTILAYQTADDVELSAAEQRDFGEILVKRLDPDGKRGLTVRFPNSRRVEIAIPRGEEHELFVDTVKVLMARKGSLEFLIAANETGDRDAIIETKNWFALENERHAEHETELAQRFANSQPPPTPGKDWQFAGKKPAKGRERW